VWVLSSNGATDNTEGRFGERTFQWDAPARFFRIMVGTISGTTLIAGGHFKLDTGGALAGNSFMFGTFTSGGGANYNWRIDVSQVGGLYIFDANDALIATIPYAVQSDVTHHLEVKVTHANAGTMEIKLDGATIYNNGSIDTMRGASLDLQHVGLGGQERTISWSSLIVMDGSGSTFNDFIGDYRFELSAVDADGATANWTPSAGSNFQCIDDPVGNYDSDTTYISSSTTDQDNYASHDAVVASGNNGILFVELLALARADAAGDKIAMAVNSNGTINIGPDIDLVNGTYRWRKRIWETDPDTTAAWTVSGINAAEWGVRKRV
jgi:hypothetical protein